jgi:hypothetical protein
MAPSGHPDDGRIFFDGESKRAILVPHRAISHPPSERNNGFALGTWLTKSVFTLVIGALCISSAAWAGRVSIADCPTVDPKASQPLHQASVQSDGQCHEHNSNGYPLPDPYCTPGAINPSLTLAVLTNPNFRTGCVRDQTSSAKQKDATYGWYGIKKPSNNVGRNQLCEKDHLISLQLGGADSLDNIWPQCGPDGASLNDRYFKQKDAIENYLAAEVRAGRMALRTAQLGIASDWTAYLRKSKGYWQMHKIKGVQNGD